MTFGRHRWLSHRYRTPWGDVPCLCAGPVRDAAIVREMIPRWLWPLLYCFLHDTDRAPRRP
jgi:hypothetical protein